MEVWILGFLRVEDAGKRALIDFFYTSRLAYCESGS
jgi:hypothetical protein